MNILKKLWLNWKSMPTAEKINIVIDTICGVGGAAGSLVAGAKLADGKGKLESACIRITAAGLGIAAADVASQALKETYGECAVKLIEKAKEASKEAGKEAAHE